MTGSMSGKEKHDAGHPHGSLPFCLDHDSCSLGELACEILLAHACSSCCPYQPRRHFDFAT